VDGGLVITRQAAHRHHHRCGAAGERCGLLDPGNNAIGFQLGHPADTFLHAQGVVVVLVVIAENPERLVAHGFIETNGSLVVDLYFEAQKQQALLLGNFFPFLDQQTGDPGAALRRINGDGIQARQNGATQKQDKAVTHHHSAAFRHQESAVAGANPVAEAAAAEPVGGKTQLLQLQQGIEIRVLNLADMDG